MSGRRPVCPVGHGPMIQSNEPGGVVWACLTCVRGPWIDPWLGATAGSRPPKSWGKLPRPWKRPVRLADAAPWRPPGWSGRRSGSTWPPGNNEV